MLNSHVVQAALTNKHTRKHQNCKVIAKRTALKCLKRQTDMPKMIIPVALDLLEPFLHALTARPHSFSYEIATNGNEVAHKFTPLYTCMSNLDMEAVYDWCYHLYIFTSLHESSTELRSWSSSMDNFLKALDSSVYLVTTCLYRSCNCLTSPGLKVSVSEFMKGNLAPVVYQFEHYDYEQ